MNILDRLREDEFIFVTAVARNKFRSILYALDSLMHIALAPNSCEPPQYRIAVNHLFHCLSDINSSLTSDESFTRPIIYTILLDNVSDVISSINANQPESIFRLLNRLIVIKKEIETLLEQLRN